MKIFPYNISERLSERIKIIDDLKKEILLCQISPKEQLKMVWEREVEKIYWLRSLLGKNESKSFISRVLSLAEKKSLSGSEKEIWNQKRILSYLYTEWYLSSRILTVSSVLSFAAMYGKRFVKYIDEGDLSTALEYTHKGKDHPVVQAILIAHVISENASVETESAQLGRDVGTMLLYKYGYGFGRLLVMESYWAKYKNEAVDIWQKSIQRANLTLWLEYYTEALVYQLRETLKMISERALHIDVPATFFHLSDRQKEILYSMERPDVTITNRKIQKLFKVSQVTSSRDLSALVNLGLLFPHGKGRSVYYTKV